MLNLLKDNVVFYSGLLVTTLSAFCYLFLYAYLSTFDVRLIWIVEYSDITNIIFVLFALGVSSLYFVINSLSHKGIFEIAFSSTKNRILTSILVEIIPISGRILSYYLNRKLPTFHLSSFISLTLFECTAFLFALFLIEQLHSRTIFRIENAPNNMFSSIILIISLGHIYGLVVKESANNNMSLVMRADKGASTAYQNAKLILILSHHTIFEINGRIVVVPTSDILEIAAAEDATVAAER